jgi:hypothetical protein
MTDAVPPRSAPPALQLADAIGISLFCVLLLIVSYFRSRHCMFWSDEIMGWFVLRQPTWHDLLHLWNAGIDSSGIWFYVLGRPWVAIFGASEISLHEFSAAGLAASGAILWIVARRFYSILPVAATIVFVFSASLGLSWQLANGRTYGVFLLANSLVIYLLFHGENPRFGRPSPLFLVASFAAYSFLIGSHILGVLYAGFYLAVQLAFDLRGRRFRPVLYLSVALSFLTFLLNLTNLRATIMLGKPVFWTQRPTYLNLLSMGVVFDHRVAYPMIFLLVLVLLSLRYRARRAPVYLLALGFTVLDILLFYYSRFATSIYVNRYTLPFSFISILILSELFTQLKEANTFLPRVRQFFPAVFLLAAAGGFFLHKWQRPWLPFHNYTGPLMAMLPPGLPVIDTDPGSFVEIEFYQHNFLKQPLLFPADRSVALDPRNVVGASGFNEMDNFKSHGLYVDNIVPTSQVLDRYPNFVVITGLYPNMWLPDRILSDPRFSATNYGTYDDGDSVFHIWVVHRVDAPHAQPASIRPSNLQTARPAILSADRF